MNSRNGSFVPLLEAACALVSGLLMIGVLGYAIVFGPGTEIAADEGTEIGIALSGKPAH